MSKLEESIHIQIYDYGIVISSPISLSLLPKIMEMFYEMYGFEICDALIASHYRGSVCMTTEKNSEKWRTELNLSLV